MGNTTKKAATKKAATKKAASKKAASKKAASKTKTVKLEPVRLHRDKFVAKLDEETLESIDEIPETIDRLVEPADPLDFADASEVEHEVLMVLTKTHARGERTWDGPSTTEGLGVVDGALHVRGDLTLKNHLFVLGDLRVDGAIHFTAPHCILAVGGKIQAGHLESFQAYIHALEIDVAGFAHLRSDGHIWAIEKIKARVLWDDASQGYLDAEFEPVEPTLRVDVVIHGTPGPKEQKKLEQILGTKPPEDPFAFFRAVQAGEIAFAPNAKS